MTLSSGIEARLILSKNTSKSELLLVPWRTRERSVSNRRRVFSAIKAQDRETAFIESQPFLEGKYQAYAAWGQDKALPGNESFSVPYQDLAKDRFLLGSPDDIVSEFRRYADDLGVNHMICRMQWPGMPQEQVLKQIELLGREVIPRIKDF